MSFLRLRHKCFSVTLKGFDYYQIDSSVIEKNVSPEEVIKILGKPDHYSVDSGSGSELLYDFEGLYNSIHIEFVKNEGKQYISSISFGV